MIVYWSAKAKARLKEIYDYIDKDSPIRARQVVDRLTRRSESLALLPRADRPVPEYPQDSLREVLERLFRIIFLASPDRLDVVTREAFSAEAAGKARGFVVAERSPR